MLNVGQSSADGISYENYSAISDAKKKENRASRVCRYPLKRLESTSDYLMIKVVEYKPPGLQIGAGKEISTTDCFLAFDSAIRSGKRCKVCGPKTISTNGARFIMASPSWLATQPPTPTIKFGFFLFRCFILPRSEKTFSSAFSRTEQVLNRIMSASSGELVSEMVLDSASRSDIFPESYSFI